MSSICVEKSSLFGTVCLPPSKSHTLRACLCAALSEGTSRLYNVLASPDTTAMLEACCVLGAHVDANQMPYGQCIIHGRGANTMLAGDRIDAGNSGQVLRFVTACAALSDTQVYVTGDDSIQTRRIAWPLLEALSSLGAKAYSVRDNGFAPLVVQGPIKAGTVVVDGRDSQPVSALLFALSQLVEPSTITVHNMGEKPWVHLTLEWLRRMGTTVVCEEENRFCISPRGQFQGFDYRVPGDLSSLGFLLAAGLMTHSDITVDNVDLDDVQPDRRVVEILQQMGARFDIDKEKKTVRVQGPQELVGIDIDINDCIDAVAILAVLATWAKGKTRLYNGSIARHKESDRIDAMFKELSKMQAKIYQLEDGLEIHTSTLQGAHVQSFADHRIAMSLAVGGMTSHGRTEIDDTRCIQKSYPGFVRDMQLLGARIS